MKYTEFFSRLWVLPLRTDLALCLVRGVEWGGGLVVARLRTGRSTVTKKKNLEALLGPKKSCEKTRRSPGLRREGQEDLRARALVP